MQAFALPLLAMIARAPAVRRCAAETSTGAAFTLLVVKVPAATAGPSEKISAISSFEAFPSFTPQKMLPARNPLGAVTPPLDFNGFRRYANREIERSRAS